MTSNIEGGNDGIIKDGKPKRKRGRPRKKRSPEELNRPKRKRGRPKKGEEVNRKPIFFTNIFFSQKDYLYICDDDCGEDIYGINFSDVEDYFSYIVSSIRLGNYSYREKRLVLGKAKKEIYEFCFGERNFIYVDFDINRMWLYVENVSGRYEVQFFPAALDIEEGLYGRVLYVWNFMKQELGVL